MMVESHMSFVQSLLTSLTGLTVVFSVLVILALATIIIAKIVGKLTGTQSTPAPQTVPAAAPATPAPVEEDMGDIVAVLQGALSIETGIPVDKLIITSVKSVEDNNDQ